MSQGIVIELVILAIVAGALVWVYGYHYGKKMMLSILRGHAENGRTFEEALQYEEDVLNDRVPRF